MKERIGVFLFRINGKEKMSKKIYIMVLLFSFFYCICLCGCEEKQEEVLLPLAVEAAAEETGSQEKNEAGESTPDTCFVHICGAVRNPGVYELPRGSRIFEGVNAAGGFTGDASTETVNQAMPVEDGIQIWIPTREEASQSQAPGNSIVSETTGGLININTASAEMLCTLPGVGKAKAESIITYREQKGKFNCIEDIMKVEGIKEGLFGKVKDKITV